MKKDLICINCPRGCNLTVEYENGEILSVTGNSCKRGITYANDEILHPKRVVTSIVKVEGGKDPVTSVRTNGAIPKELIFDVMKEINAACVASPAKIGDVAIENVLDTGVDVIITRAC